MSTTTKGSPLRRPDFDVWAVSEDPTALVKGTVGSAWENDDGSINIKLNAFVVLPARSKLALYPRRRVQGQAAEVQAAKVQAKDEHPFEDDLEEPPF